MRRALASVLATVLALSAAAANAAEIKVISAGAVRALIAGMIDDYSKETGHKFDFTTGPTGFLRDVIATGQHADLIIASAPLMGELEKTGKLTTGSRNDLGRVGMGVVIREGAPVPDVSTPEAIKQLLLKASSIAYTDPKLGGTTVIHLMKLADRFGITDAVVKKGVLATGGDDASEKVAHGQAEIAVSLISEIVPIKGAALVGLLPAELQSYLPFAAAVSAGSAAPEPAQALIKYLSAPDTREEWARGGFELLGSK